MCTKCNSVVNLKVGSEVKNCFLPSAVLRFNGSMGGGELSACTSNGASPCSRCSEGGGFQAQASGSVRMLMTRLLTYSDGVISNLSLPVFSQYKRLGILVCDVCIL